MASAMKKRPAAIKTSPPGSPDFKPGSPGFNLSPGGGAKSPGNKFDQPPLERGETTASARYTRACTKLNVEPEPRLLGTLRDPEKKKYAGVYSTADAEQLLSTDALSAVVTAIESMIGLHTLRLVGLRNGDASFFTFEGLGALVRAVKGNASITSLDLTDDALDDEIAASHLGTLLAGEKGSLAVLTLRHNNLKEKSGKHLLDALGSNKQLQEIDLSCNPGAVVLGVPDLDKLLKENTTLLHLGCTLPSERATGLLATLLKQPQRLPSLRLAHQQLGDKVLLQLKAHLGGAKCGLTSLDLTHAYCEDQGAIALAQALCTNSSLTKLNLSHNNVAGAGTVALADALKSNACLTELSLAVNHVNDAAVVGLAEMLTTNETLTSLDLARNCFGTTGAHALRQALQGNRSLLSLGALETMALGVGLRASLEWYVRNNRAWCERAAAELGDVSSKGDAADAPSAKGRQHQSLLRLLPETERQLREQLFTLEDACARNAEQSEQLGHENYQVNRLLDVTVKRNAELVDSLSQLQAQVERLVSTRQAKKPVRKVSKKKDADKDKPTKPKVAAK